MSSKAFLSVRQSSEIGDGSIVRIKTNINNIEKEMTWCDQMNVTKGKIGIIYGQTMDGWQVVQLKNDYWVYKLDWLEVTSYNKLHGHEFHLADHLLKQHLTDFLQYVSKS